MPEADLPDCPTHAGRENSYARSNMDGLMRGLLKNQSGDGRHKCPYCAYQAGIKRGYAEALSKLADKIKQMQQE